MEAIGDITASAEVSRLPVEGEEFDSRIQGGLLVCPWLDLCRPHDDVYDGIERRNRRIRLGLVHSHTFECVCAGELLYPSYYLTDTRPSHLRIYSLIHSFTP